MMIQKAILHILDFNTNMCILSQKDLDFSSDVVYEYVDKRIERLLKDAGQQTGIFMLPVHSSMYYSSFRWKK